MTALAFRRWHRAAGLGSPPLVAGLRPEERARLLPAPARDAAQPANRHSVAALLVAAVLLWGAVVGAGVLITGALAAVRSFDAAVSEWFAGIRSENLTAVFFALSRIGDTSSIMLGLLAATALAFAITRRHRPAIFMVTAVLGEVMLFVAISQVVGRTRPSVEHLTPGLPPTSSFPSGHVGATTALYGAVAVLIVLWSRSPWRYLALVGAFGVAAVMVTARLYIGVHYLTDATASVVYTGCWLAVCAWAIQPGPKRTSSDAHRDSLAQLQDDHRRPTSGAPNEA
ncbi:MAG: phosphatase PAP2 family protein [Actinomycetota bacterium]|nr:phosphatase PAP2 family protein [Actinomycetota bacterium]